MGLDLYCHDLHIKCGSYSSVQLLRIHLLQAIKNYISDHYKSRNDLINYINKLVTIENNKQVINYHYFDNNSMNKELALLKLDGFISFINHSDYDGIYDSFDTQQFIDTYNVVSNYIDKKYKNMNGEFYLYPIFNSCIELDEDIIFR